MKIRIYYEDTDCGNVVYYANYLKYMERSRTELLRERGVDLSEYQKNNILFAVIEANVKYRAPARYNDLLDVQSVVNEITAATIGFETTIKNESGVLLVKGNTRLACMRPDGRARRIPEEIKQALAGSL
ncbi:MAG TPA: YbgC/FadM family acyl-CoA thioesterase [Chitinispirillaceae bacterium]|jgi:acyl-CoA thioester hydrolase|nr:YbgC/FadM family acyl-CoA thioesterase [Chitinispirillaceae bacterium]